MTMTAPMTIFDLAGRAMSAQLVRLNSSASNLANAGSVASSADGVYRPTRPVFRTEIDKATGLATIQVDHIAKSEAAAVRQHDPDHPLADANGDVWSSPVDETQEMVEMMDSARQYQNLIEVLQTTKTLTLDTMRLGK
jgi:flagellar basal-body rod protein FlgC